MAARFDHDADWQAYDQPLPDDPSGPEGSDSDSSSEFSDRSSVPGTYLPPHRRRGDGDAILLDQEGTAARVNNRGSPKVVGAPWDKPGAFRKVQLVPYVLKDKQLKYMQGNFPNTFFQVTKDHNHDHPIAHLETMIATRQAIDTIRDGSRVLDVYGNPGARDSFMRRRDLRGRTMETVVSLQTEKDFLRRNTKWGPANDQDGNPRYHALTIDDMLAQANLPWLRQFDVFLMIHTGYYIEMTKLVAMLSANPRSVAKMIVHRHKDEQGHLFNGEVEYVNRHDMVVQRNVDTRERYVHASMEWLFTSSSKVWRAPNGAVTWTFKKVTDETWIIDFVACPNDLDERFGAYVHQLGTPMKAAVRLNDEALVDTAMVAVPPCLPDAEVTSIAGVVVVKSSDFDRPLRLTNMKYYQYLSASVVGKSRDKPNLDDLFALARRENSLTSSFPGAKRFEVPVDEVADHVIAAFLTGVERETELMKLVRAADEKVMAHNKISDPSVPNLSTTRSKIKTAARTARKLNDVRRSKDSFDAILELVENN